jgi:TatD DNase family protein
VIDTHAHIMMDAADGDPRRSYDGGTAGVVERAIAAGVQHIVCVGAGGDLDEVQSALVAARRFGGVSAICGIHPHDARRLWDEGGDALWQGVRAACGDAACVAVGETGLDFHYDLSDRALQQQAFVRHIELASELGKPLCIHTRDAEAETLTLLREHGGREARGVIHCFSGTAEFGLRCVEELDFYLSIPGIVTFKQPGDLPEVVRRAPLERLLLETDSPFLAPVPLRGRRNEPALIHHTLHKVAALRGVDVDTVEAATTANAVRLFGPRLLQPLAATGAQVP